MRVPGLTNPRRVALRMYLACGVARVDTASDEATRYRLVYGAGTELSATDLARAAEVAGGHRILLPRQLRAGRDDPRRIRHATPLLNPPTAPMPSTVDRPGRRTR